MKMCLKPLDLLLFLLKLPNVCKLQTAVTNDALGPIGQRLMLVIYVFPSKSNNFLCDYHVFVTNKSPNEQT